MPVLHHDRVIYHAYDHYRGIYRPSEKIFWNGHFLTFDGVSIPAQITLNLAVSLD